MSAKLPSPSELARILRFDEETQRLVWLPRKRHSQRAGQQPCRVIRNGYYCITIHRRSVGEHRVIWALVHGEWPIEIDHIDGDPRNNDLSNLRAVTSRENSRNVARRSDNTSGVTGVNWNAQTRKWRARIYDNGRPYQIGMFQTLEEAAAARKRADERFGYHPNHGRAPLREAAR